MYYKPRQESRMYLCWRVTKIYEKLYIDNNIYTSNSAYRTYSLTRHKKPN